MRLFFYPCIPIIRLHLTGMHIRSAGKCTFSVLILHGRVGKITGNKRISRFQGAKHAEMKKADLTLKKIEMKRYFREIKNGSGAWARTKNQVVNSHLLYH